MTTNPISAAPPQGGRSPFPARVPGSRQSYHSFAPASILLAEDEIFNRRLVEQYLAGLPFELRVAEHGADAMQLIRDQRPDLLLLDLAMPVMDGHQVLDELRHDPELRDLPVLVLSASRIERRKQWARISGARGFLQKPIVRSQLLGAIAGILPRVDNGNVPPFNA